MLAWLGVLVLTVASAERPGGEQSAQATTQQPQLVVRQAAGQVVWHAWRPDARVVYATRDPNAVWVADGPSSRRLSAFKPNRCPPSLSADGKVVAFSLGTGVGLFDLGRGKLARVKAGGEVLSLAWRAVPSELAYSVGNTIHLVGPSGSGRRLLRRVHGYCNEAQEVRGWRPCRAIDTLRWSANGRCLGYLSWVRIEPDWLAPRFALLDVNRNAILHYEDGYRAGDEVFAISPDGQHWTMGGNWGDVDSKVMIDGQFVDYSGSASSWPRVSWSPDGQLVAWEVWWVVPGELRNELRIYETPARGAPARVPDAFPEFEWSPDGKAFVYHRRQFQPETRRLVTSELRLVWVADLLQVRPDSFGSRRPPVRRLSWNSIKHAVLVPWFQGTDLSWSPGGKRLSWVKGRSIWSIPVPQPPH
jgi:hypothetical protein